MCSNHDQRVKADFYGVQAESFSRFFDIGIISNDFTNSAA
jgi:hypothetical protein